MQKEVDKLRNLPQIDYFHSSGQAQNKLQVFAPSTSATRATYLTTFSINVFSGRRSLATLNYIPDLIIDFSQQACL
jgi:hypothetical protein